MASTCPSRWASWRPAGRSTRRGWRAGSLRANCRARVNCGRCAAHWPWPWRAPSPGRRRRGWCNRRPAPGKPPWYLTLRSTRAASAGRGRAVPAGGCRAAGDRYRRLGACTALCAGRAFEDLADVKGHTAAKRVLQIAAAGGHSLLMMGPPGSGKSMLAHCFAGLLPSMSAQEALESAAVASLCGRFSPERWMQRPTAAPHQSAGAAALVGGGAPPLAKPIRKLTTMMSKIAKRVCARRRSAGCWPAA